MLLKILMVWVPDVVINVKNSWGGGASADYWVDIDNISFSNDACTGTPVAGTSTATLTSVCTGSTSGLSNTGSTAGVGIIYQWISSPDDVTYTNITGATSASYTATVMGDTYYRMVVTCGVSMESDSSNSVFITGTPNPAGDTQATAISAGDLLTTYTTSGDNLPANCWTHNYGNLGPDVYYTFTPSCDGPVTISTCGSSFDTKVWLLNSAGGYISDNDDYAPCGTSSQLT